MIAITVPYITKFHPNSIYSIKDSDIIPSVINPEFYIMNSLTFLQQLAYSNIFLMKE